MDMERDETDRRGRNSDMTQIWTPWESNSLPLLASFFALFLLYLYFFVLLRAFPTLAFVSCQLVSHVLTGHKWSLTLSVSCSY